MKKVRFLDSAWLLLDAPETPMHVGILLRFSPPADAPSDYIFRVVASLRGSTGAASPWDLILPVQKLRGLIPLWFHECYLDMEHHVRLYALSSPGDEQELADSVAELHSRPLDRTRPLWECHVFTGLADGQFALYVKVHHALLDGVGGVRMMQNMLAHSPDTHYGAAPWVTQVRKTERGRLGAEDQRTPTSTAKNKQRVMSHLASAVSEMAKAARRRGDQLVTPFRAPTSPFNRRITSSRAYSTEIFDMARIMRVAHLAEVSSNDVVLAICAGALRRYLTNQDIPPMRPLTVAVPVSTRPRHSENTGSAMSFCLATLGTDIACPRERVATIRASTKRAKEFMGRLPRAAMMPYTTMLMLPFVAGQFSRIVGRMRPMFNIVISNVPGPKAPLYLEGARLESISPLSVLFRRQALNITCIRYLDKFSFGFTGCPDALPDLHLLPKLAGEALTELESEFSFPRRGKSDSRKAGTLQSGAIKQATTTAQH